MPRRLVTALSVVLSVVLSLACGAAGAQNDASADVSTDDPAAVFTGMIEISEVLLDVVVTDAEGRFVPGLGTDDFVVEEDGEPVKLTSVSYYTTRYGEGVPVDLGENEVPSSRYFIFFFHRPAHLAGFGGDLFRQQIRATHQSRRWLDEEMRPSDWVAVVSYCTRLVVHQDFTQDRDALERAFGDAATGRERELRAANGRDPSILDRLPNAKALKRKVHNVYQALGTVAEASHFVVGRKNLLLFTPGFGVQKGYDWVADPRYYPDLELQLNDHNVAVYPIDVSPAGRGERQTEFLTRLAGDTGGIYYEDFIGFLRPLREIAGDNYAYYVLSYQSEHPAGEVGYQRVEVRTVDESVEIRTRTGYRFGI